MQYPIFRLSSLYNITIGPLIDYIHTTRTLPFSYAEHIARSDLGSDDALEAATLSGAFFEVAQQKVGRKASGGISVEARYFLEWLDWIEGKGSLNLGFFAEDGIISCDFGWRVGLRLLRRCCVVIPDAGNFFGCRW